MNRKVLMLTAVVLPALLLAGCFQNTYDFTGGEDMDITGYSKSYEALGWLEGNPNEYAFAGNRFDSSQAAKEFVRKLYDMGAKEVFITSIFDEEWRIKEEGGPYADTLIVTLPADSEKREAILEIYRSECSEYECNFGDEQSGISGDTISFWWD